MSILAMMLLLLGLPLGSDDNSLSEPLRPLAPFVGKTWKGTFKNDHPQEKGPKQDVSRWERALNGRAVRVLHSVDDGEYGGETLITWDEKKHSLIYFYFTTAGFYTTGTMKSDGNKIVSHEQVTGNANGITEVRATTELLPEGAMHVRSEYLHQDKWVPGHEIHYTLSPDARVIFK